MLARVIRAFLFVIIVVSFIISSLLSFKHIHFSVPFDVPIRLSNDLPRREVLRESFLAYMHIPKTGGSSFNKMLVKTPLLLGGSNVAAKQKPNSSNLLNCGLISGCCAGAGVNSKVGEIIRGACRHISYEAKWTFWETFLERKRDALLLTHLREPTSHAISMLGHDLRKGRFGSFQEKIYNETNKGYVLGDFLHEYQFSPSNTTEIVAFFEHRFFWFGITEHFKVSLCLLLWQLHSFDSEMCQLCKETSSEKKRTDFFAKTNTAHSQRNRKTSASNGTLLSQADLKEISMQTAKDRQVYNAALSIFFNKRVEAVEDNIGFRFFNCHLSLRSS